MSVITYAVAASEVARVRRALLGMHAGRADSLSEAVAAYLVGDDVLTRVMECREQVAAVERMLDQLGWELVEGLEAVSVSASRVVLAEAYQSALVDAVEAITEDGMGRRAWPLDVLPKVSAALRRSQTLLGRVIELSNEEPR
jgi:hypothetical protein